MTINFASITHEDGKRELTPEEGMLAQGRTGAAYINKADRLDNEQRLQSTV